MFTLLVDSHHEAPTDSPQQAYITYTISCEFQTYAGIDSCISSATFLLDKHGIRGFHLFPLFRLSCLADSSLEILDAVAFLTLLFPNQCNPQYRSRIEDLVLGLTCCSLLLPTLALYKLAQSDFGKTSKPLGLKVRHDLLFYIYISMIPQSIREDNFDSVSIGTLTPKLEDLFNYRIPRERLFPTSISLAFLMAAHLPDGLPPHHQHAFPRHPYVPMDVLQPGRFRFPTKKRDPFLRPLAFLHSGVS